MPLCKWIFKFHETFSAELFLSCVTLDLELIHDWGFFLEFFESLFRYRKESFTRSDGALSEKWIFDVSKLPVMCF